MDESTYQRLEAEIASDDSPVGIDAKKTHVMILAKLESIDRRLDALEARSGGESCGDDAGLPIGEIAGHLPGALAAFTDAMDEEVARAAQQGNDIDAALRNGLAAVLYLGQRVSTKELEALGTLLRSDVLHPSAVDVVGRLGCALVAAADQPRGSVGPMGAFAKLTEEETRTSTAFVLEFAKQFGAALSGQGRSCAEPLNGKAHP